MILQSYDSMYKSTKTSLPRASGAFKTCWSGRIWKQSTWPHWFILCDRCMCWRHCRSGFQFPTSLLRWNRDSLFTKMNLRLSVVWRAEGWTYLRMVRWIDSRTSYFWCIGTRGGKQGWPWRLSRLTALRTGSWRDRGIR